MNVNRLDSVSIGLQLRLRPRRLRSMMVGAVGMFLTWAFRDTTSCGKFAFEHTPLLSHPDINMTSQVSLLFQFRIRSADYLNVFLHPNTVFRGALLHCIVVTWQV